MGAPPLRLDYARNTYLVLSTVSPSPPPLPTPARTDAGLALAYAGRLGPGALENEHVFVLEGVPSGALWNPEDRALVDRARVVLLDLGVGGVEVMQPTQRAKR
ncbi:hypothetical protein JCM3770_003800 [Rhodotorula araucariae]